MSEDNALQHNTAWARGLTVTGIVIAILNMAFAWIMMFSNAGTAAPAVGANRAAASEAVQKAAPPALDKERQRSWEGGTSRQRAQEQAKQKELYSHVFSFLQDTSASAERRTTLLLGFCFALISIGFSLFVMGIQGAIGMRGQAGDFGSLIVKTGSPGLFCILLASLLVALSLIADSGTAAGANPGPTKVDVLQAEADTKEQLILAETAARERVMEAESLAKERQILAETNAKIELLAAAPVRKGANPAMQR